MAKNVKLKPNRSLRENARQLVPHLMENFLSYRTRVVAHPRLKRDFHKMRIAGKTLRYAMEVFESGFGDEFDACLDEVKRLLELMGQVHDCDVCSPALQGHLREIRSFNRVTQEPADRIRTKAVTDLLQAQRMRRKALYADSCLTIQRWVAENFAGQIAQSMTTES